MQLVQEQLEKSNHLDTTSEAGVREYPIDFTRLLAMQWADVDNTIRHADLKAQLLLGINALVLAGATSAPFLDMVTRFKANSPALVPFVDLIRLGALVFIVLSVFFALMTIFPRAKHSQSPYNTFYFGDIVSLREQDYVDRFMDMSLNGVKAAVLSQIYAKSFIITRKFHQVRLSLVMLAVGLTLWATMYLIIS
jgi:hypothetical protein